jgi:hypothetical protein
MMLALPYYGIGQQTLSEFNKIGSGFPDHQKQIENVAKDYQSDLYYYLTRIYRSSVKEKYVRIEGFRNGDDDITPYCKGFGEIFTNAFKRAAEQSNNYAYNTLDLKVIDFYEEPMRNATFKMYGVCYAFKDKGRRFIKIEINTDMPAKYLLYGFPFPPSKTVVFSVDKKLYNLYKKSMASYKK